MNQTEYGKRTLPAPRVLQFQGIKCPDSALWNQSTETVLCSKINIQTIIFDLDGVLFDGADFHKRMFLKACERRINSDYHDKVLNGMSTKQKLDHLVKMNKITEEESLIIDKRKQELTETMLPLQTTPGHIYEVCKKLSEHYNLYCVSNSIRKTLDSCLHSLNIYNFFKGTISNEDTGKPKPDPEPYLEAFRKFSLDPLNTLILEDSPHGRKSAYASGAHVLPIVDVIDTTYEKIIAHIANPLKKQTIHIVIPMAGRGSRFVVKGYKYPKPFIPVFNKPMIQWVIENMMTKNPLIHLKFIFIAQNEHIQSYSLEDICKELLLDYHIIPIDSITEGPACTVLLAKDFINNDIPLVTVNSDQFVEWNVDEFYRALLNPAYAGVINTFHQPNKEDNKWSFAKINKDGIVEEVAEKRWISPHATSGIYGWSSGKMFVENAEKMILQNERVNNEFYVCPVYNYVEKVRIFPCKKLWGLGVPEDLEKFLENFIYGDNL